MIEEILSEIKTAEKSAAQVVAKAEERAEQIRAAADEQCAAGDGPAELLKLFWVHIPRLPVR